jgi:ABC-type Fe3+-siderophore transport system permease subunit
MPRRLGHPGRTITQGGKMESPSRLRYVAAALLGILGVGSFVEMVLVMMIPDPLAHLAVTGLLVSGVAFTTCALLVLSDALGAWLLAGVATGVLVWVAISYAISQRGIVWADPVGLAVVGTAGGMVLVIGARAIEARRDRERDAAAIGAWRRSRDRDDR